MSPGRLRFLAEHLIESGRAPIRDDAADLGEAILEWVDDPIGLPIEAFLGVTRDCGPTYATSLRDKLIRDYAACLSRMRASTAANLIIDQVHNCDVNFAQPDEYGPLFVVFYTRLKALGFELPEHSRLRRIIG